TGGRLAWPVGHEPDADQRVDAQAQACGAGDNECILHDVKCVRLGVERGEGGGNIVCAPDFEWHYFEAERVSCSLKLAGLPHRTGIAKNWLQLPPGGAEGQPRAKVRAACCQSPSAGPTGP